ncbi:MAG: AmmeMemoRadiSam system radical SAM enzyme [Candidatus Pacearchaeota archaeon]
MYKKKERKKIKEIKELKEALYYRKLKNNLVRCNLCPRFCVIRNGERGNCGVRENINGKLYSLVYGKPCSMAIDPIEKKPFYHFLPGSKSLSIATVGCNLHCLHCQNWEISQAKVEDIPYIEATPRQIVEQAKIKQTFSISYTYTEPTVFYEYMLDIAKIAKKEKLRNNIVTNGFINPTPLKKLCNFIDAANIDLKGNALFYEKICQGKLEPVLEAIKILHQKKVWIELTNLIIPGYNDNIEEIKKMVLWILENLDNNVPLHFSAFYPCYKLTNIKPTEPEFLMKARVIAKNLGLNYVYTGNIIDIEGSTTFCPNCNKPLIVREGFYVKENRLINGKCPYCNEKIAGVWK